jgi:hypothetical protein
MTHSGGKVASPGHRPPSSTREDPWYSFLLETRNHSAAGTIESMKVSNIPWEIEPATFRLVAQRLNQNVYLEWAYLK